MKSLRIYVKGQLFVATAATAFLDTNEEDVTCVTSGSSPGSKVELEPCLATPVNTPYEASLVWFGGSDGKLQVFEHIGQPGARVSCGFGFMQCRFSAGSTAASIVGGNPATGFTAVGEK